MEVKQLAAGEGVAAQPSPGVLAQQSYARPTGCTSNATLVEMIHLFPDETSPDENSPDEKWAVGV